MFKRVAYFFVYHGSRDKRSTVAAEALARSVSQVLDRVPENSERRFDDVEVDAAYPVLFRAGPLELGSVPLHQQLMAFAHDAAHKGVRSIVVVPLFLLPGTHVCDDIPAEVSRAQKEVGASVRLILHSHLGNHPQIVEWLRRQLLQVRVSEVDEPCGTENFSGECVRVLMSHGSKRAGNHQPTEAIAHSLDAKSAYWALSPSLGECLEALTYEKTDHKIASIQVIPYFLFSGKITDAIAQTVQEYQHRFSQIRFHLSSPIGEQEAIAELIAEWLLDLDLHNELRMR